MIGNRDSVPSGQQWRVLKVCRGGGHVYVYLKEGWRKDIQTIQTWLMANRRETLHGVSVHGSRCQCEY